MLIVRFHFFSDTPVRSEWSELQSQEQSEQKISEVSPFGIGTAIHSVFLFFCYFILVCYRNCHLKTIKYNF